jgi:hypothetical protein
VSQKEVSPDEILMQMRLQMAKGNKDETLKFRRVDKDWKVVVDEDFLKASH